MPTLDIIKIDPKTFKPVKVGSGHVLGSKPKDVI